MSSDAYASISNRVVSLEDIIRQQEQTIGAVLQRLRDVEQYAATESRNREQAQQQIYQLLGERGGSSAEAAQQMQAILQSQNERLGSLQAEVQGQAAALRGLDDKYGAALRGVEQRMQADVGGVHQRAQTGETASQEAMRSLQAQLQGLASATQSVDARSRDDLLGLQQQLSGELAAQRQRTDNLESAIRDALRDVHGSLTAELRGAATQQRSELDSAVQRVSQSVEALDQRTRADMNQLHTVEQGDVTELGRRIEELERGLRATLLASTNGLASEVAQVAQHSQSLDRRQAAAHQTLLQELAKHDAQLEAVDLNWRASVTDLGAVLRDGLAGAQQQTAAGDQALQRQLKAVEDRVSAASDAATRSLGELNAAMQETCVRPVNEAMRLLTAHDQRLGRVAEDYATTQDSLKAFATRIDQDASQFRQVVEAAVRASHADLLERIHLTSAAITMQQDPDTLRSEVNRALARLWEEAKGAFLTQHSLNEMQAQLATLESAVRVELCALAERNNAVQRGVDVIRIAQQQQQQRVPKMVDVPSGGESASSLPSPLKTTSTSLSSAPGMSPLAAPRSPTPMVTPQPVLRSPVRSATAAQTDPLVSEVVSAKVRASLADDPLPPPPPPLQAFTFEPVLRSRSPRPRVEEIDRDESSLLASRYDSDQEDAEVRHYRQHERDIKELRASLNRMRQSQQVPENDKASASALLRMEENTTEKNTSEPSAATRADDASRDAQQSASQAGGALHAAKSAAKDATAAHRDAADAAEKASVSSQAARHAATHADTSSREARGAAAEAAESLRAAEAAQNETVRVANELRQALRRVQKLEESVQQRLQELNARDRSGEAFLKSAGPPSRAFSLTSSAAMVGQDPPPLSRPAAAAVSMRYGEKQEEEDKPRLYEEYEEPAHPRRVTATAASQMSFTPTKSAASGSAAASPTARASSTSERVVEVPGISKGEVFIVRQEKTDRTTPVSVRVKPGVLGQPPLAPTPLKESAMYAPSKPPTPSESDMALPSQPPRRGSGLSEVLLPTHQFVRKREYGNFKDFTKQEIDALWVELLNLKRTQGMPREEVLLQVSQSREQILNKVLQILQRQESETLGMLGSIKLQLTELRSEPPVAPPPEVNVFPMDNGRQLEEFMRAISSRSGSRPSQAPPPPPAYSATASVDSSAAVSPRRPSPPMVNAAVAFKTDRLQALRHAPVSAPAAQQRQRVSQMPVVEREPDTAASSARSTTPLVPQIIPSVVHRRSSLPSRDELPEVFFADVGNAHPPRLFTKPRRSTSAASAPSFETTQKSAAPTHLQHLYAVAAPVFPSSVTSAQRPAEPASATGQYRPTGLAPPAPTAALAGAAAAGGGRGGVPSQRPSSAASGEGGEMSPHHIRSPYVSPGLGGAQPYQQLQLMPSPVLHAYQHDSPPGSDARKYLKEGTSARNPAASAYHLNPLLGVPPSTSPSSNAAPQQQQQQQRSPPRREPGGSQHPTPPREDPQEASWRVIEAEPKPHDARPPRYQLIPVTPPQQGTMQAAFPPGPLTDTSPQKYQPMSIGEGSDIYFESVEGQRPPRRTLRRSSASVNNSPMHPSRKASVHQGTLPPGHLYSRQGSAPDARSMPRLSTHTAAPASPRGSGRMESMTQPGAPVGPLYPPVLPAPQPRRDYSPLRDPSTDAVRTSMTPPSRSPPVQVLPSKGPIHLGAYNAPRSTSDEAMDADTNASDMFTPPSPSSLSMPLRPHADHNRHVYAPHSGRDSDVYSTTQSLGGSPSPELGGGSRGRRRGSSRHSSATGGGGGGGGGGVPVRVLDAPRRESSGKVRKQSSATTIRIHPYQDEREM